MMNKILLSLLLLIGISSYSQAGLPPTTSKDSADASNITTFFYQFPHFTGTHTGVTFSLGLLDLTSGVANVLPYANGGTNANTSWTQGSVIFAGASTLAQDNANFFWDATNHTLGLMNATPASTTFIDAVNSTGATKRIMLTGYGTGSVVGHRDRFARGTSGSPAAVQSGDVLGFISAQGFGLNTFPSASTGVLNFIAGETFTNSSNLTYATINATPTGSITAAEAFRVASTGVTLGPQSSSTAVHAINGGLSQTTKTVTTTYTVDTTTSDFTIFANTSGGAFSITLPAPTNGRILNFVDPATSLANSWNTNNLTLVPVSSAKILGLAGNKLLTTPGASFSIQANGTDWFAL